MIHLVVWLGEVVEGGDVFQEDTELCRQVFEHQAMVVSLLQLPHMFLRMRKHNHTHTAVTSHHFTATWTGLFSFREG